MEFKTMTTNSWNMDLIHEVFEPESAMTIMALQWPDTECEDNLLWKEDNLGRFTVGSSYMQNCIRRIERNSLWEHFWQMDVHERLKLFLWRVA